MVYNSKVKKKQQKFNQAGSNCTPLGFFLRYAERKQVIKYQPLLKNIPSVCCCSGSLCLFKNPLWPHQSKRLPSANLTGTCMCACTFSGFIPEFQAGQRTLLAVTRSCHDSKDTPASPLDLQAAPELGTRTTLTAFTCRASSH